MLAGKPGAVLELKVVKPSRSTPSKALSAALAQIEERGYAGELTAAGASPVHAYAVAFRRQARLGARRAPASGEPRRDNDNAKAQGRRKAARDP